MSSKYFVWSCNFCLAQILFFLPEDVGVSIQIWLKEKNKQVIIVKLDECNQLQMSSKLTESYSFQISDAVILDGSWVVFRSFQKTHILITFQKGS